MIGRTLSKRRTTALAATVGAVVLAGAGSAVAAPYVTQARIAISGTSVAGGSTIAVSLTGFEAGETVDGSLDAPPTQIFRARMDASGQAALQLVVPDYALCGAHLMLADGESSGSRATVAFTIVRNCR